MKVSDRVISVVRSIASALGAKPQGGLGPV